MALHASASGRPWNASLHIAWRKRWAMNHQFTMGSFPDTIIGGVPPTTSLECLLIADDLTGACDAAVHFARRGYRTHVRLDSRGEEVSVLAISAESRDLSAAELRQVMNELAQRLPVDRARILFKKIDSTLRGNVGAEIAAAA